MSANEFPSRALVAELRNVEQTASPAPWKTVKNNHIQVWPGKDGSWRIVWSEPLGKDVLYVPPFQGKEQSNADAFVAVVARNALPMLLNECDALFALVVEAAKFAREAPGGETLAKALDALIAARGERG